MNNEGLPKNTHIEKEGLPFRQFEIAGGHILLTEEGNQLLHDKMVLDRLHDYIQAVREPSAQNDPSSRIYFRQGGNAHVYLVGDLPLAIKEMSNSRSTIPTLTRLETLRQASRDFPPHIKVPLHYGVLSTDNLSKEYLLMQKIGDGLNVMDIIEQPDRFGEAGTLAVAEYHKAKEEVERVLRDKG